MEAEPKLQGQPVQQELIEVHQLKSDSTHQHAVRDMQGTQQRCELNCQFLHGRFGSLPYHVVGVEQHQSKASAIKTVGVLQPVGPVVEGIGAEPCGFYIINVMESVGCRSWQTRSLFAVHFFCFDAGGECQSRIRRARGCWGWRRRANVWRTVGSSACIIRVIESRRRAGPFQVRRRRRISVAHPLLCRCGVDIHNVWRSTGAPACIKDTAVQLLR